MSKKLPPTAFQPHAKLVLSLLGSAVIALIVAFVLAGLSVSGVTSTAAADILLWIAFFVFIVYVVAIGITRVPGLTGEKAAFLTLALAILCFLGWSGRSGISQWIHRKKQEQISAEKALQKPASAAVPTPVVQRPSTPPASPKEMRPRPAKLPTVANSYPGTNLQIATAPCTAQSNGGNATVKDCGIPDPYKGTVTWTPDGQRITRAGNSHENFAPFASGEVFGKLNIFLSSHDWNGMLAWAQEKTKALSRMVYARSIFWASKTEFVSEFARTCRSR